MWIFPPCTGAKHAPYAAKTERNCVSSAAGRRDFAIDKERTTTMTFATPTISRSSHSVSATASDFAVVAGRWTGLSALARLAARFAEYRQKQRMIAELEALDDRHLKDIGMVRGEIWHRVYHRDQYDRMPGTAARNATAIHQVVTKRLV